MSARSEVQIRQVCHLGLESRIVMPKILELLHGQIDSFANVFFWIEEDGQIRDIYDEYANAYAALPTYHEKLMGTKELEVWCGLREASMTREAVHMEDFFRLPRNDVLKHDFYQLFLKKVGSHWTLHKSIWVNDQPRGILHLKRNEDEKNFSAKDLHRLESISGHIEHALASKPTMTNSRYDQVVESAKLIVDIQGAIHHYTNTAERIMMLSQGEEQISTHFSFSHSELPANLKAMVASASKSLSNRFPSKPVENRWGEFNFSVSPLSTAASEDFKDLYMLQIDHFVPIRLFLFNQLQQLEPTDRQLDICFGILEGKSYAEIADELGIQESTVTSHKKEIFRKASVSERRQFVEKIYFDA